MLKALRTLMGILLVPVAIGTGKAFYILISGIDPASGALHVLERGVLIYLLFHVLVIRPAYLYVLGHELVHVIATWLCGGRVVSFNVSPAGGNVVTSKTNFFIELSPYFVPLYTILLGPLFILFKAMNKDVPQMSGIFLFLVGLTLAFHFVMTTEVLKVQQSDVVKSGFIFSIILIFIGNLVITMAVFSPVFDNISFLGFLKSSTAYSKEIYRLLWSKTLQIAKVMGIW